MNSNLLRIAKAFDANEIKAAETLLQTTHFADLNESGRKVLLGFWRRLILSQVRNNDLSQHELHRLEDTFSGFDDALSKGEFWRAIESFDTAEGILGARQLSAMTIGVLGHKIPESPYWFQYDCLTRCFIGGDQVAHQSLFAHLLRQDKGFVPDYWQFQSLVRSWSEAGRSDVELSTQSLLERTKRLDLHILFRIYLYFVLQTDATMGFELGYSLEERSQKDRLSSYLLGASQTEVSLPLAVELHKFLCAEENTDERNFMEARLAVSNAEWERVKKLTENLIHHPELKNESVCLRALAHAHLGDDENAKAAIDHVRFGSAAPWFLRARASLLNVSRRLLSDGVPLPNDVKSPQLRVSAGKPLAQSLWVGSKLRWIEELSLKSYLTNGWRYQLYTYEPIENVPDGVEVLDASAILPRSMVFAEGANSGMHKGSVGAFSDLFRYALICKRGGMWTDTDVINLRKFEPDGARFISTERSDAGIIGLNGALMAAPAGDPLQEIALMRSQELIERGNIHFARIGPELLAELIGDGGLQGYRLLPTDFMNPIGWMETGRLLQPHSQIKKCASIKNAHNLHVYTETWRLLGLSLSQAPSDDSFLSVMYDRLMNARGDSTQTVLQIMRR